MATNVCVGSRELMGRRATLKGEQFSPKPPASSKQQLLHPSLYSSVLTPMSCNILLQLPHETTSTPLYQTILAASSSDSSQDMNYCVTYPTPCTSFYERMPCEGRFYLE